MATRKPTLTVTLPDGRIATRCTDHEYTHVVACQGGKDNVWDVMSWHHGRHNADKALETFCRNVARATYQNGPGERYYVEPGTPRILPVGQ